MQILLAVTPEYADAAARCRQTLVHMAYRIGSASALLRQNLLLQTQGGLLGINDREAPIVEDPEALCSAVLRESRRRNYSGVVLDFEQASRPDLLTFAQQLGQRMQRSGRPLYVPETYASVQDSRVLICTALSGGNFTERLREAAARLGGTSRTALDLQRLRMDFPLPCRSGCGQPLSQAQLDTLIAREHPSIFFSEDLCARYFTYRCGNASHFVLFDDADTLRRKLRIGTALGFSAGFFMWPEISDLVDTLFK